MRIYYKEIKAVFVLCIFLFSLCSMPLSSINAQELQTIAEKGQAISTTVTSGKLEIVELKMPQFSDGRTRKIRVWLPQGYDPSDTKKTYPVMYMNDGQNLFDAYTSYVGEWKVDESISKMMKDGYQGAIIVGIDNGELLRPNELSPEWKLSELGSKYITKPDGDKYAAFITETVKPYIDAHYNTKPERKYTGIGGSSMGGTISFYIAMEYPEIFGYSMVLSPALHLYEDGTIEKYIENKHFSNIDRNILPSVYIYAGGTTGNSQLGTPYDEACIKKYVDIMRNKMLIEGYPQSKIKTLVDVNNTHSESAWASVFPAAYKWYIDTTDENSESVPVINDSSKSVGLDAWCYKHLILIDSIYYLIQHLNNR